MFTKNAQGYQSIYPKPLKKPIQTPVWGSIPWLPDYKFPLKMCCYIIFDLITTIYKIMFWMINAVICQTWEGNDIFVAVFPQCSSYSFIQSQFICEWISPCGQRYIFLISTFSFYALGTIHNLWLGGWRNFQRGWTGTYVWGPLFMQIGPGLPIYHLLIP